jgi:hypothetical protein
LADPDDTDQIGEATLLAFTLAQLGGRGQALPTLGAALEVWRTLGWRWLVYEFRAWRRGRRASWLVEMPWEELLPLPPAGARAGGRRGAPGRRAARTARRDQLRKSGSSSRLITLAIALRGSFATISIRSGTL